LVRQARPRAQLAAPPGSAAPAPVPMLAPELGLVLELVPVPVRVPVLPRAATRGSANAGHQQRHRH